MIKKLTLTSLTALSLLLVTAQAEGGMKCAAGKCGAGMMQKGKMGGNKMAMKKKMMKKKMMRRKMNSPFLIKHGLPHLTRSVMQNWDNPAFALTAEQKTKLTAVRKETMGTVLKVKPEVIALRKEIVQASMSGAKAADLKAKVDKLASLEAEATMVHLNCIEKTKDILSKDQLLFLLANKNKHHGGKGNMMKKGMGQGKGMKMKCGSGKCGAGMKQGTVKIETH
ncbi:hypothetical protein [Sulfurovum sp.]|uniref:hypothetical protein n=1 Tax=Sulfurovum sp. TaxID=1969726 RepID=UPI0025FB95A6|nr:hypothetical protein [Sulfurovum sp.]